MIDREQIRRDAEAGLTRDSLESQEVARHCLALLDELEQAERQAKADQDHVFAEKAEWREKCKQVEREFRGFDDGLSGAPARSKHALYQTSWKRGMEKRRDLLLNDLGEAS